MDSKSMCSGFESQGEYQNSAVIEERITSAVAENGAHLSNNILWPVSCLRIFSAFIVNAALVLMAKTPVLYSGNQGSIPWRGTN